MEDGSIVARRLKPRCSSVEWAKIAAESRGGEAQVEIPIAVPKKGDQVPINEEAEGTPPRNLGPAAHCRLGGIRHGSVSMDL
jgi:hypothetical protein